MDAHRAQVREDAEPLAQPEEPLLRPDLGPRIVPLRTAHRAQQHRARRLAHREDLVGQRRAVAVDGAAAHEALVELESVSELPGHDLQHAQGLRGHLGTDAIARQHDDLRFHLVSLAAAMVRPYSTESTSARQLASMMLVLAPTVLQVFEPSCVSMSTRVMAAVPVLESRMRTL